MVTYLRGKDDRNLHSLVNLENGEVSREVYVNEDIYAQELEQIFGRAWLFVGHESQVPNPGDFVLSLMGTTGSSLVIAPCRGLEILWMSMVWCSDAIPGSNSSR